MRMQDFATARFSLKEYLSKDGSKNASSCENSSPRLNMDQHGEEHF